MYANRASARPVRRSTAFQRDCLALNFRVRLFGTLPAGLLPPIHFELTTRTAQRSDQPDSTKRTSSRRFLRRPKYRRDDPFDSCHTYNVLNAYDRLSANRGRAVSPKKKKKKKKRERKEDRRQKTESCKLLKRTLMNPN